MSLSKNLSTKQEQKAKAQGRAQERGQERAWQAGKQASKKAGKQSSKQAGRQARKHDDFREHWASFKQAFREHLEHSEGTQRILKEQSERNQRERDQSDFVILSEPKILRLVLIEIESCDFTTAIIGHCVCHLTYYTNIKIIWLIMNRLTCLHSCFGTLWHSSLCTCLGIFLHSCLGTFLETWKHHFKIKTTIIFLAPTGALEEAMSVCRSPPLRQCLSVDHHLRVCVCDIMLEVVIRASLKWW